MHEEHIREAEENQRQERKPLSTEWELGQPILPLEDPGGAPPFYIRTNRWGNRRERTPEEEKRVETVISALIEAHRQGGRAAVQKLLRELLPGD